MNVLQICSKPPLPAIDGGCKAMCNITNGLLDKGIKVKLLTISTHKHPFLPSKMPASFKKATGIEHVEVNTRVKPLPAFVNLCLSKSYNLTRFYSKRFEDKIIKALQEEKFDIVLLEGLFVSSYLNVIRDNTDAEVVFRAHNVEHEIWERNTRNERSGLKKVYLNKLAQQLKKQEIKLLNKVDKIATITEKDKQQFKMMGCIKQQAVIPFGINLNDYPSKKRKPEIDFFHIGSMDWEPNIHGINWLVNEVWKNDKIGNAKLTLAGKNMPSSLLDLNQPNVNVVGEVEDAIRFINDHQVMVVPLFSGSGMRVKIIEGMALGKTIIATQIAMEGIDYNDGENVLIANNKEEFEEKISWCIENPEATINIGENAKTLIAEKYDNKVIIDNLIELF